MIAAALIDENRYQYSSNSLSVDYLGEIKAETELREAAAAHGIDPKAEMWKLPAEHVGYYAARRSAYIKVMAKIQTRNTNTKFDNYMGVRI